MKAIDYIDQLLTIEGNELAGGRGGPMDPLFVDVVAGLFKDVVGQLAKKGFMLVPGQATERSFWMASPDLKVLVVVYPAFGGKKVTGFPTGFPQRFAAVVQAGFVDTLSPAVLRRFKSKKNPQPRTFAEWKRQLNGVLLKHMNLGTWHLTRQPYEDWFDSGLSVNDAAALVAKGYARGTVNRRYKRRR